MNNNREDIILSYILGTMPDMEARAFEKELEADKDLLTLYEEYIELWTLTNQLSYETSSVDEAWSSFQNEIPLPKKVLSFNILKIAASVLLLAALTFGMWFFGSTDISLTTGKTAKQETLTDGSIILLNSNSHIFSDNFDGKHRELILQGEAKFKVTKGKNKFLVHTCNGDLTVYGTEFNVFTDKKMNMTLIELYEGSVGFTTNNSEILLKPGERLIVSKGQVSVTTFQKPVSWTDVISCQDAPLSYVLGQLQLAYNIQFDVKPKLLKERYTLNLPKDDLTACLTILNQVSGKNFALIENTIVVK